MTYDLIVIGSGPGGYSAAVRAGQYGLKTAIVEKDAKLGGTCLHVGCIPTKALLHTADVWEYFLHAKGVEFLMKKNKVDWIKGYGALKGGGKIEVKSADGKTQTLEAKNIMIAT